MAITASVRGTPVHSTSAADTYTLTDAGTPTANTLVIAFGTGRGSALAPDSGAGYGLTWVEVGNTTGFSAYGVGVWAALTGSSPDSTDPVLGFASNRTGCHFVVVEIGGAYVGGTVLQAFIEQSAGVYVAVEQANSDTASFTLNAAHHANNRAMAVVAHGIASSSDIVDEAAWTQLDQNTFASPNSAQYVGINTAAFDASPTFTKTSGNHLGIAFEIRSAEDSPVTVVERSASFDAAIAISSVPQRALLRSAAIGATIGINSVPQRELNRSASIGVGVEVSSVPQRELIRSALFDALISISSAGSILTVHERSVSFDIGISISSRPQRELIRSASFEAVVNILTTGLVPRIVQNFFDIPDSQTCMNPTHHHGTVSARPFTRGTTAGREIRRGI